MGFSFRNLFPEKEGGEAGQASQPFGSELPDQRDSGGANSAMPPQGAQAAGEDPPLFENAQPTDRGSFEQMFAGARPNEVANGVGQMPNGAASSAAPGLSATYLAGELLQFIPPALASPDAVPLEQPVYVSLPADGSRDVKLSALYLGCPQLFATEITPLNDSQVTLPDAGPAGGGGAGAMPGMIPDMGAGAPANPFGNPLPVENQSQQDAASAAGTVPNPFDPRGTTVEPEAFGAGTAPQAATPAPMTWQQEEAVPVPELTQEPIPEPAEQQAPFASEADIAPTFNPPPEREQPQAEAPPFAQVENSAFGAAPIHAPESVPVPDSAPTEAPPNGGNFSGEQSFDPQASMAGPQGIPPFSAPSASPSPAVPENSAPALAPASEPAFGGEPPRQDFPYEGGGDGGGDEGEAADDGGGGSPFSLDEDNPFFLADEEDQENEQGDNSLLGTVNAFEGAATASPVESDALPTPSAAPGSPADLMGALEPAAANVETPAEPAMPWPAAPAEAKAEVEAPSFGDAFSGGNEGPTPEEESLFVGVEEQTAAVEDLGPAPAGASVFGSSGVAENSPAIAEAGAEMSPPPAAAETLATGFAAAVPANQAPSLMSPSPFEAAAPTPVLELAPTTEGDTDATLEFVVRDLLFPHQPEALGFSADSLPYELMARVPLRRIEPQLASGRVTVALGDLAVAVDPPHGETLAQGNQNLEIELPPTALFHQLERVSEAKAAVDSSSETADDAAPVATAPEPGPEKVPDEPSGFSLETPAFLTEPPVVKEDAAPNETSFGTAPSEFSEPQKEVEAPLPPAGASSGFSTPFSELAKEDEASVDPPQETRFSATPPSEDSAKAQMRFGTYPTPQVEEDRPAEGERVEESSPSVPSSPPPLPIVESVDATAGPDASAGIWQAAQIPGPLRKSDTLVPGADLESEPESELETPIKPPRSISISVGPGAVTPAGLEEKLSPLSGAAATNDSETGTDDSLGRASGEEDDDAGESMIFTSSRPDNEVAQDAKSKSAGSVAEDSLDTLPTFADLMARNAEGAGDGDAVNVDSENGGEETFDEGVSDFFAELEPPPFSFQHELEPQAVAASQGDDDEVPDDVQSQPYEESSAVADAIAAVDGDEFRDLELRAIFGTTEEFTLRRVAELTLDLCSTIDSCALLTRGRAVDVSRRNGLADDGEAQRRGQQARAMHRNLRDLADNAGLTQAQALTLHTDREAISFFQRGDICLTVRHDRSGFPEGVREKLMLVAHGVTAMEERR